LIGVGIIGTLLPIIPGMPMVIAGVALVGPGHPVLGPLMTRIERWRRRRQGSGSLQWRETVCEGALPVGGL
jgi:hypothetical protein